jgi:hypothetical protein
MSRESQDKEVTDKSTSGADAAERRHTGRCMDAGGGGGRRPGV